MRHSVDSAPFEIREVRFISYQLARVVPSTFVLYVVVKVLIFFFYMLLCSIVEVTFLKGVHVHNCIKEAWSRT